MFRSVLVPLDGSTFAEHALPYAVSIARHAGATLRLVRVLHRLEDIYFWAPLPGDSTEIDLHKQNRAEAHAYLEDVGKRLGNVGALPLVYDVIEEGMEVGVTESIRADVVNNRVDLVVMTSHGRGAVARVWLGSVADELVRTLSVPLLLVRPGDTVPDLGHPVSLQHFLIALDGTALAEKMVEQAETLGKAMGAAFTLLRVVRPALFSGQPHRHVSASAAAGSSEKFDSQGCKDTSDYLQKVAERMRADGKRVETRVVAVADQPAVAILEEAGICGADLIALETHGRRGLSRLLLGGTADKVIRGSSFPVLVCRCPDK